MLNDRVALAKSGEVYIWNSDTVPSLMAVHDLKGKRIVDVGCTGESS